MSRYRFLFFRTLLSFLGSFILAFGIYNIHSQSEITEGGILGMALLLQYHAGISPAVSSFILNTGCYLLGWKAYGWSFLWYSFTAGIGFSLSYRVLEQFRALWPDIAAFPFAAAVFGAVFVGIGCGICVYAGGAPTGDDALGMGLSRILLIDIRWIYLCSDMLVLALSLSYIPATRIIFSLMSVLLSGQIIGWIQKIPGNASSNAKDPPV